MRLTILTIGTRGDLVPYLALGLGLAGAGHEVTLATYPDFEEEIQGRGLGFYPLSGGVQEVLGGVDGEVGRAEMEEVGNNPVRLIGHLREVLTPLLGQFFGDCLAACRTSDAIISSPLGFFGGYDVAELLQIPFLPAYVQPIHPTRGFPSLAAPEAPGWLPLEGTYNLLTHHLWQQGFWQFLRRPINEARREVLDLNPLPLAGPFGKLRQRRHPTLYGWSPIVLPKPPDWGEEVSVTGYWCLRRPEDWRPPEDLVSFLSSGPPPVYVGFGSMPDRKPGRTLEIILQALEWSGRRAVLLSAEPLQRELSESVHLVEYAPHDWLLPRVAAAIHHGGAGTIAAALRAGIPSVVVPFLGDQSLWAGRVHALGAGPAPIPRKRLTAARLAGAIRACAGNSIERRAAEVGEQIDEEDGVAQAVGLIGRFISSAQRERAIPKHQEPTG